MEAHTTPVKSNFLADMKIGAKLSIGFGVLVALIFFSALVSYQSSAQATGQIQTTDQFRVPTALQASKAQANLLRMLADVRGYLALGDESYRVSYIQSALAFETDLAALQKLSPNLGKDEQAKLQELRSTYEKWKPLPEQLFELRDDQLDREPAYRKLATDGVEAAGKVIIDVNTLIAQQGNRDVSIEEFAFSAEEIAAFDGNIDALLEAVRQRVETYNQGNSENLSIAADMARFQGNFSAMLSALRGYVTTRNRIYRGEYEVNLTDNQNAWNRLQAQKSNLTEAQQKLLDNIEINREAFLKMPDEIFSVLESEEWRTDLYRFTYEAVPLANQMDNALKSLVDSQQATLTRELSAGSRSLAVANQLIVASGIVALLLGLLMAYLSRRVIADPITRLTNVAEEIRSGALDTQARVESRDEIGVLASTFNNMTGKLRQTLNQVRREKKRADDLLNVVIPIGVELSTEKDFNRLLEKMLMEAKNFCHAETGMLYMSTQGKNMEFVIVRSDFYNIALGGTTGKETGYAPLPLKNTAGEPNLRNIVTKVALKGETINIGQSSQTAEYDLWGDDPKNQVWRDYKVNSMLSMPLKDSHDNVLGVLQLINSRDAETGGITPFDENIQRMMESFSSLAVAALEAYTREFKLKQEIQQLRIEIDEAKQKQQVKEIVDSDFFQNLTQKARDLRQRRQTDEGGAA